MKTLSKPTGAFTLVELLVIIAILGVFVLLMAPALASTKDHSQRAMCANNMREQGLGTAVYAEHYDGRYPITQAGGNPLNRINGAYYTRWLFLDGNRPNFHLAQTWDAGTAPDDPNANGVKTGTFWRSFGMLYPERLAGDGSMFYCPGLNAKGALLGAANYQPLLTTSGAQWDPSTPGSVRGSYTYNPWVDSSNNRLYVKISDLKGRKVFGMDFMDPSLWDANGSVNTESINFAHSQAKGWNILFSDNSVDFKRIDKRVLNTIAIFPSQFGIGTGTQYDIQGIDLLCASIFEK